MVDQALCGLPLSDRKILVSEYCKYLASFRSAILFVIGSVIYHVKWIEDNLPYFASRLYMTRVCDILAHIFVTENDHCKHTKMSATGIPESFMITK
jgi:hypothetical protein